MFFLSLFFPGGAFADQGNTILFQGGIQGILRSSERGGIARAKTFVDDARSKASDPFLVSCGSMLGASSEVRRDGGKELIQLMNDSKYDVMALGPHDFFAGSGNLLERAAEATFPFICTNLQPKVSPGSSTLDWSAIKPWHKIKHGALTVLTFGIICPGVASDWPGWDANLALISPVEAIQKFSNQAKSADVVLVLSNMSFKDNVLLLKKLPWIHVVITNPMTPDEIFFGESLDFGLRDGRRIFWTQGADSMLGSIEVHKTPEGAEVVLGTLPDSSIILPDEKFTQRIEKLSMESREGQNQPMNPMSAPESTNPATAFLNALRIEMNAEVSMMQTGALRFEDFVASPSESAIRNAFPFPDRTALVMINGANLRTLWNRRNDTLIASSGLAFAGITVDQGVVLVNNRPLNDVDQYRMATTEFIALGGLGLLPRDARSLRKELVVDLFARHFSTRSAEKRDSSLRRLVDKPVIHQSFSLNGSFHELAFSDSAKQYQYSDAKAAYTGSDIPSLVGIAHRQKTGEMRFEHKQLRSGDERIARLESTYSEFKSFKMLDNWQLALRYRKTSLTPRWLPFAECSLIGTNLEPDVANKHRPFFGKGLLGLSRKGDKGLDLFVGVGEIFRFSMDGSPKNFGLHVGYEYNPQPDKRIQFSSRLGYFASSQADKVRTYEGDIRLKFTISDGWYAEVRQSEFGWNDSVLGGTARRSETFTGIGYALSLRRF